MSLKFVSLLAEPLHTALRELCRSLNADGLPVEFQVVEDWRTAQKMLSYGDAQLGAVCGLLYTLLRAQGTPVLPLLSPVLAHPRYRNRAVYWADVVVRADSPIESFDQLQGKDWLYNEPGSYSGYHAFRAELQKRKLGVDFLAKQIATGSHANSMARLLDKEGDFSVLDSTFLDNQPDLDQRRLRRIASIGPAPAPVLVGYPESSQAFLQACQRSSSLPKALESLIPVQDSHFEPIRTDYNLSLSLDYRAQGQYFVRGHEPAEGRPFTSLAQKERDQSVLARVATELLTRFQAQPTERLENGIRFHRIHHQQREHHHYLIDPDTLHKGGLSIVGFLSQMKPSADIKALFDVDDKLLGELSLYEGFLSYSPTEYKPGLWANLATFRDARSRDRWAANSTHLKAIKDLGPSSYDNVRLHLGVWPSLDKPLEWIATRYLNYTDKGLWRGVRTPTLGSEDAASH